jgi:carboxymethylenebutenolidase
MGEMVNFPSNGGTASGYLAKPASGGGKGVIVIQEWWGLNDNITGIADRFAAEGFMALAPDMYHGKLATEPDEAGKLLMALDFARAEKDLRGAVTYLKDASGGAVGTVGFCMGGALSLFAACNSPGDVGACADFYGGHPAIQYNFGGLKTPVLGIWAEHDDFVNPSLPRIEEGIKGAGVEYESKVYPGTAHAFFNDTNKDGFNKQAADDAWQRTLAFYRKHL